MGCGWYNVVLYCAWYWIPVQGRLVLITELCPFLPNNIVLFYSGEFSKCLLSGRLGMSEGMQ